MRAWRAARALAGEQGCCASTGVGRGHGAIFVASFGEAAPVGRVRRWWPLRLLALIALASAAGLAAAGLAAASGGLALADVVVQAVGRGSASPVEARLTPAAPSVASTTTAPPALPLKAAGLDPGRPPAANRLAPTRPAGVASTVAPRPGIHDLEPW
ncbi:MAG: hypothetical protein R3F60_28670 [bacterium]